MEGLLAVRYPPYEGKYEQWARTSKLKPNFDRDGNVNVGLIKYILTLGGGSVTSGATRWFGAAGGMSSSLSAEFDTRY